MNIVSVFSPPAPLAVLTDGRPERLAILTAELADSQDGWHQLLPAGRFKARDGRPFDVPGGHWLLDGDIAAGRIARAQALGQDLLIDYEHQALHAAKNGKPAPAAGWFGGGDIEWRKGEWLFIRPRWTQRAQGFIAAGEYVDGVSLQRHQPAAGAAHGRHYQYPSLV
ncbi:phage protease [Oceanimonas baumannii]|uniref:Mu-like prophage I protein n=1 Tax=Oceanimonas baumannii TaxID=129578 RepID=A0ABY2F1D0_9GAMM|nr:phage protease [Oceanimonas baumannii]TDW61229.1 Mu-like prophage I protein [Oceanimonas baumannii]